ncbi:Pre-mRNA-splicing factor ATP-dependent RNA helicase PRP16 [Gracilariopsis chorda]|uniref:RNA helicase n=1 Tax=Gracilariopsis chorda TaxID=448386 RepID=A0A2V3J942_9FLOR|nr:Pre-mRNA-splicing factor ATP-dependent RNA helicase PRP16 [Gracilariopsis chorda]|eukprot:PXF49490.1 Pre-mRNA-splicing factor ATP-dependent RNA helicase PRP16 [Gracilariopsis chorda]
MPPSRLPASATRPPPRAPAFKQRRQRPKKRRAARIDTTEQPSLSTRTTAATPPSPHRAQSASQSSSAQSRWGVKPSEKALPKRSKIPPPKRNPTYDAYLVEQQQLDRQWYLGDEYERTFDDAAVAKRQSRRLSAAAIAKQADAHKWENTQLSAALGAPRTNSTYIPDDSGPRLALVVQELHPPFLHGFSASAHRDNRQDDHIVYPVKDVTSDMAVIARKGSPTVEAYRLKRERGNKRESYWELGHAPGAKAKESDQREAERGAAEHARLQANQDWKQASKFSNALLKTTLDNKHRKRLACEIESARKSLPVYQVKRQLLNLVRENQVCVIVGETGSGKTTQLTQYLEEEGYATFGIIGCTQPRRVAAVSVAQRVAEEFRGGVRLGEQVGYAIRFEDVTGPNTLIKYMTDGILLRESLTYPDLERYSVIVMDEAHERSLNTDVLFGLLRNVIAKRRDLRVIITSATLNADRFANFFGDAPVFNIPGRTFPVDTFFSKTPMEDYVDAAVWQTVQLHIQAPLPGDILIFMTGQEDIETTCEALADKVSKLQNPHPIIILPIYSQLATDLQAKIFEPAPDGVRKVVVATNIAETSLTIDGIRYVVDAGYCKLKTYNPQLGMDALLLCPASQSSVDQRAGRAGRTAPGKCYRLFTSTAYVRELLETNVPEIQRTNLSHVVLLLKTLGVDDILEFPFLDPPPRENVLKSMLSLWLLGALDANGKLTSLGREMSSFPLDPGLSSLLFTGMQNGCLVECLTIVAMLSVPNVFVRPQGREEESDAAREKFFVPESDHLTLLHVYQRWIAGGSRAEWCAKHYISSKSMRKAREVREQLLDMVRAKKMVESSCDDWDSIRKAIGFAFFYQAARRKGVGEYVNIRSGVVCGMHPTSAMYGSGLGADYVVYHELIMTRKEFMSCITAVEVQWLAEAGPMLYVLKHVADEGVEIAQRVQQRRAEIEDEIRRSSSNRKEDDGGTKTKKS